MKISALAKVLLAIFLGLTVGFLTHPESSWFGVQPVDLYALMRDLFLNALKLVMVPLVASSIIVSVSNMKGSQAVGRLGFKALITFACTTLMAILVGWLLVTLIEPGTTAQPTEAATAALEKLQLHKQVSAFDKFRQLFLRIIPPNIIEAAGQANMLAIILFALLTGFCIPQIEPHAASTLRSFFSGIFQVMMRITHLILKALPFGVFGMIAHITATTGLSALQGAGVFFFVVLGGLALVFPLLFALIYFYGKVNPLLHLQAMSPALVTAFTTSSSAVTLPVTLECLEERVGISNRVASFVAALGTSMNLAGSALFMVVAVFYLAQSYGVHLMAIDQMLVIAMILLLSFGLAGLPSASLLSIIVILDMLHIPAEALGLIIAVERFLDMCRTPTSVFTCSCSTLLVALSEGERPAYPMAFPTSTKPVRSARAATPHTEKGS